MLTRLFSSLTLCLLLSFCLSACRPAPLTSTTGPSSPSLRWKVQTKYGIVAPPFVHQGRVLFGNTGGEVTAASLTDGRLLWKKQVYWGVWARIAWVKSRYLVASRDGYLYAFSATGTKLWRRKIADSILSSPAQDTTRLVWTSLDTNLFLFLQKPEVHRVWTYSTRGPIYSSPVLSGDVVYFGANDGFVYAVNLKTRRLLWKFQTGASVEATPRLTEKLLLVGNTAGRMLALERKSGRLRWSTRLARGIWSTAAVSKTTVFVGSNDSSLVALSRKNGGLLWRFRTRKELSSSPIVVGKQVVFGGQDGAVRSLDAKSGRLLWRFVTKGAIEGEMTLHNKTLLVGAGDGALYALKLPL